MKISFKLFAMNEQRCTTNDSEKKYEQTVKIVRLIIIYERPYTLPIQKYSYIK